MSISSFFLVLLLICTFLSSIAVTKAPTVAELQSLTSQGSNLMSSMVGTYTPPKCNPNEFCETVMNSGGLDTSMIALTNSILAAVAIPDDVEPSNPSNPSNPTDPSNPSNPTDPSNPIAPTVLVDCDTATQVHIAFHQALGFSNGTSSSPDACTSCSSLSQLSDTLSASSSVKQSLVTLRDSLNAGDARGQVYYASTYPFRNYGFFPAIKSFYDKILQVSKSNGLNGMQQLMNAVQNAFTVCEGKVCLKDMMNQATITNTWQLCGSNSQGALCTALDKQSTCTLCKDMSDWIAVAQQLGTTCQAAVSQVCSQLSSSDKIAGISCSAVSQNLCAAATASAAHGGVDGLCSQTLNACV